MNPLTVDFELIASSMRDLCRDANDYYLDKSTGRVFAVSRSVLRALVDTSREHERTLPAWEARMMPLAREIVLLGSTQFVRVPEAFGCPEHKWMADFSREVRPFRLRQKLILTLRGRGCCSRFKEILRTHPTELQDWLFYVTRRWEERIQQWLESLGILAVNAHPRRTRTAA